MSMVKSEPPEPPNGESNGGAASSTISGGATAAATPSSTTTAAARTNAKDPSRPRRKKARRACFACQRAHLTCGDERPCQRCIKRGLQEACQDGVRKKAKYLHDAPIDDGPAEFAPQPPSSSAGSYPYHPQMSQQQGPGSVTTDMLPPDGTINPTKIESPSGPLAEQQAQVQQQQAYSAAPLFDPSDPALFNFDIASLNFGSQYGAMEFGMLGQMSTNAPHVPGSNDGNGSGPPSNYAYSPGVGPGEYAGFSAPQDTNDHWPQTRGPRESRDGPFANTYMIEAGPGSLTSPSPPIESPRPNHQSVSAAPASNYSTAETPAPLGSPSFFPTPPQHSTRPSHPSHLQQVQSGSVTANQHLHQHPHHPHPPQTLPPAPPPRIRRRDDPSHIYTSVTQPYPYAIQHHRLFHMLESRFPKPLLLRIARAMASFRPSFIACTQALAAGDLVFMEKCFQRTLWEYERFIQQCGTPTIICRRTGEVVGVGKEFCMLTGWERSVLLGEKRNANTNPPWTSRGPGTLLPPPDDDVAGGIRRPVFLAELLDDESVVEFYEQFARLAFGDSRGAVMTTCTVLTYKGPPDDERGGLAPGKEGRVDCAFCWTIKRDVFDIPMLIVGNFLPILGKASESG